MGTHRWLSLQEVFDALEDAETEHLYRALVERTDAEVLKLSWATATGDEETATASPQLA